MLWRALKSVKGGFYIDVGAQHPIIDSVSCAFYEQGWRGVHIEPVPQYADLLRLERPDEKIFQVALGAELGLLTIHVIPDTGLSTPIASFAEKHNLDSGYKSHTIVVEQLTLNHIFEASNQKTIHWLKIDVEGGEKGVIQGWDKQKYRPWIVVIEATLPNSEILCHSEWENLVTENGYIFTYFDGLNRYYISTEKHDALAHAFKVPPNVFDNIPLSGYAYSPWTQLVSNRLSISKLNETNLAKDLNDSFANIESKNVEIEQCKTNIATFQIKVESKDVEIEQFKANIATFQIKVEELQLKLETLTNDFNTQLNAASEKKNQLETIFNNALKTKNEALEDANKKIETINHQLQINNEALENANEQVRAFSRLVELNETSLADAGKQIATLSQTLSVAEQQITAIYNSSSWKLSKPIRLIGNLAKYPIRSSKNIIYRLPNSHQWLKNSTKKTLKKAGKAALKYPWLKNKALGFLYSRPALKAKLRFLILTQETTLLTQTVQAEAITEIAPKKDLSAVVVMVKKHNLDAVNAQHKTPLESYFY